MAKVKYGFGIAQLSGRIGGSVYARNSGGNYVRVHTDPINPNTARQIVVRSAMAALTTRWSQILNASQREKWNLYGAAVVMKDRFGDDIYLSGFNHYIRSNLCSVMLDLSEVDDGPAIFELPAKDPTFAITISETTQNITASFDDTQAWAIEDGAMLFMFQGSPQNAQRNFFDGPWRLWTAVEGSDPGPAVTPKIAPAVFPVAEGQRIWAYARILRADGRISEPFRADCFCDA